MFGVKDVGTWNNPHYVFGGRKSRPDPWSDYRYGDITKLNPSFTREAKNDYPTPVEAINSAMNMDTDEAFYYLKAWQHGEDLSEFDTPIEDDDHER